MFGSTICRRWQCRAVGYLVLREILDNTGVRLSRRDRTANLIASGFPDFARCRVDVYPFGSGFFIGMEAMTKEEFEAYKAAQIAALLAWDIMRQEVTK